MSASPEAIRAIDTVARQLGELRDRVVFIGGVVRGLLITDTAVQGSRATKDVDVIAAGIATTAEYYTQIHSKLQSLGFEVDTSEGAPLCRWKLNELIVDVMPPVSDVLGFSNRWYLHAVDTAVRVAIPTADREAVEIRLVTGPSFLATKLEAFAGRGKDDYVESHDVEDIVAVVDGRPSLVEEVEREPAELREYVAGELQRHLARGLADAVPGHLAGDEASQRRVPLVMCALDRLRRRSRLLSIGEIAQSQVPGGQTYGAGPWRYEMIGVEERSAGAARRHIIVRARLTNLSRIASTVGDGRNVHIEDARGLRFPRSTN